MPPALADRNPELASHLADWAWYADSDDPEVAQGALNVYARRVAKPLPTQEVLVYAEHMVRLQLKLNELNSAREAGASQGSTVHSSLLQALRKLPILGKGIDGQLNIGAAIVLCRRQLAGTHIDLH